MNDDDYRTEDTIEFPPEPPIELTDEEIVELLIEWSPVVGYA